MTTRYFLYRVARNYGTCLSRPGVGSTTTGFWASDTAKAHLYDTVGEARMEQKRLALLGVDCSVEESISDAPDAVSYSLQNARGEFYIHTYTRNAPVGFSFDPEDAAVWVAPYLAERVAQTLRVDGGYQLTVVPFDAEKRPINAVRPEAPCVEFPCVQSDTVCETCHCFPCYCETPEAPSAPVHDAAQEIPATYHPEALENEMSLLSNIAAWNIPGIRYLVEETYINGTYRNWYETAEQAHTAYQDAVSSKTPGDSVNLYFLVAQSI